MFSFIKNISNLFKKRTYEEKLRSRLVFRENGDVDYDKDSREPRFVEYNNLRLKIALAKHEGKKFVMVQASGSGWKALVRDGYHIRNASPGEEENGCHHKVSW